MVVDVATILVSAGVGGVAGSVFPVLKSAVDFVVFQADSEIAKLQSDLDDEAELGRHQLDLVMQASSAADEIMKLSDRAYKIFVGYKVVSDITGSDYTDVWSQLEVKQAFLSSFSRDSIKDTQAALHFERCIQLSKHMCVMLKALHTEATEPGLLAKTEDGFTVSWRLTGEALSFLSACSGSSTIQVSSMKDTMERYRYKEGEVKRTIQELERRRFLSLMLLKVCSGVSVLIGILFLLRHFRK